MNVSKFFIVSLLMISQVSVASPSYWDGNRYVIIDDLPKKDLAKDPVVVPVAPVTPVEKQAHRLLQTMDSLTKETMLLALNRYTMKYTEVVHNFDKAAAIELGKGFHRNVRQLIESVPTEEVENLKQAVNQAIPSLLKIGQALEIKMNEIRHEAMIDQVTNHLHAQTKLQREQQAAAEIVTLKKLQQNMRSAADKGVDITVEPALNSMLAALSDIQANRS